MSGDESYCPKCQSIMERGWIADRGHNLGADFQTVWVRGEPETTVWSALQGGEVTAKGDLRRLNSLRCTGCGFLELYAP